MLDELLTKGQLYCGTSGAKPDNEKQKPKTRASRTQTARNTTKGSKTRKIGKRQINFSDVVKTVREVGTALRGDGTKNSGIGGFINGIQDTVKSFSEGGGPLDGVVTQIANIVGFNISSSADIVPSLFMKAFTEVTVSSYSYSILISLIYQKFKSILNLSLF
jgi:hypothetical protein